MICGIFNLPEEKRTLIVVVIEPDNLGRMQKADPISLESLKAGGALAPPMFPFNTSLLIAYEEDHSKLVALAQSNVVEFIRYLERGRKWMEGVDGTKHNIPIAGKCAERRDD
ncbi:MAG TPA: hypothetical protein VFE27_24210 [Acidobacteriaceae bacterium]|jgi:hypothetical protein|nr:hypothetical protein [Acidobacteriaceae bacterium]